MDFVLNAIIVRQITRAILCTAQLVKPLRSLQFRLSREAPSMIDCSHLHV